MVSQCPSAHLPEYAFIGRSNVGKSSLINYITDRKELAMISSKPGKTKTINHFLINTDWYLVDLPGYGYAQASKTERKKYEQMIRTYLSTRENLICTYVLIDARIPPQKIDLEFIDWLGLSEIPFELVFTKADKSKKTNFMENIQSFCDVMHNSWEELPQQYITSSQKKEGKENLLQAISAYNEVASEGIKKQFDTKK